ncbi:MAG: response regulator [Burkholderiaceae bacterium]|nr:response regulator [Burkholderiaceae bacterium]
MTEPSDLSILIIDPNPRMRSSLQGTLSQASINRIDYASNAAAAVRLLNAKSFDIILCEYELGDGVSGQDGQQLLEDLRRNKLIGASTIFIMLTSEAVPSKVVGTAELTPADYILKPFTLDLLGSRIARAIERRRVFMPAYQLLEQGRQQEAIEACLAGEADNPRYGADFARLRAELHLQLGQAEQAEQIYLDAIGAHGADWAHFGLARALFARQRFDEARASLSELITRNPRLMAAYDMLAKTHEALGETGAAQQVLEDAVSISPNVVQRLRHLGGVAQAAGDIGAAERAFRQVVTKVKYSEFRDPEDHLNLVKALVSKGDADQAGSVIRDLERTSRGSPNVATCSAIAAGLLLELNGNARGAANEFTLAAETVGTAKGLSSRLRVGLMHNCLEHQLDHAASNVVLSLMNDADNALTVEQAGGLFAQAGRPDLAREIGVKVEQQVATMMSEAAEKSRQGELREAVALLARAVRKMPANVDLLLTSVEAILAQINAFGWEAPLAEQAAEQMHTVARLDPAQPALTALHEGYARAQAKYGISTWA